jgi:glutathione S-transferase
MLELYHFNDSVCAQKVRVVLAEKGLEWVLHHVDLMKLENLEPSYLELNPQGVVPTLVHDGQVVTESTDIIEYLDDHFPEPPLRPSGAESLKRMRDWIVLEDGRGLGPSACIPCSATSSLIWSAAPTRAWKPRSMGFHSQSSSAGPRR